MATVLIVEDDRAILDAVAYNLERDGHEVLTAADGVEGLELARKQPPDLVVLDIMLPRMSGIEVCRLLRQEQRVPILMLTARDSETSRVEGLQIGADDYITKPFSMRELRARVESALRRDRLSRQSGREQADTAQLLSGGDLAMDIARHEVRKAGRLVALRPREFELLAQLMRHPDRVLTREQIVETVWGYEYLGGSRTVDVHVRWLREKLEDDPSRPEHLVTVRNFGYKFVP